jgi:hypothetical protein
MPDLTAGAMPGTSRPAYPSSGGRRSGGDGSASEDAYFPKVK